MASPAIQDSYMDTTPRVVETSATNQFVTFTCAGRAFGVDIMSVREIRSWSATTELPSQPFGAKGVLDIRGSIVQVYDLAVMLGSHGGMDSEGGQVVLVVSLKQQDVGLLVDTVSDIIFAQADVLRAPPASKSGRGAGMDTALVKTADRLIAILDLGAMFPDESAGDSF